MFMGTKEKNPKRKRGHRQLVAVPSLTLRVLFFGL